MSVTALFKNSNIGNPEGKPKLNIGMQAPKNDKNGQYVDSLSKAEQ